MSLKEASSLLPQVSLMTVVNAVIPSNSKISHIDIPFPGYMAELACILLNTPKEVMQTYFMWKVLENFTLLTSSKTEPLGSHSKLEKSMLHSLAS